MATKMIEDAQTVVDELRHIRGKAVLSEYWKPIIAAENLLLSLAAAADHQAVEKELPDAGGWWWHWQAEYFPDDWEMLFVVKFQDHAGSRFLCRASEEEDFDDEPCTPGRWVRCTQPPIPGGP